MYVVPGSLRNRIAAHLNFKGISVNHQGLYQKWIRSFFDFCEKYRSGKKDRDSLEPFMEKLKSKRQSVAKCEQARLTVLAFLQMGGEQALVLPQPKAAEPCHGDNSERSVIRQREYNDREGSIRLSPGHGHVTPAGGNELLQLNGLGQDGGVAYPEAVGDAIAAIAEEQKRYKTSRLEAGNPLDL